LVPQRALVFRHSRLWSISASFVPTLYHVRAFHCLKPF
jgi:hypothetical protein